MLEYGLNKKERKNKAKNKIIGIYKITNPKNKVYIGQSLNIHRRFLEYKRLSKIKSQIRLKNSFIKYGIENHKFEILIQCSIEELNTWERYYQDLYMCIGRNGLNCLLTNTNFEKRIISEETKMKISNTLKGRFIGEKHHNYGLKMHNEEMRKRIGELSRKSWINGINKGMTGKTHTKEVKEKLASLERIEVLNIQNGIYYDSINDAAFSLNLRPNVLAKKLSGFTKTNNTPFVRCDKLS